MKGPTLEQTLFSTVTGPAWRKIGVRHHHGIAIPLISIRTENSAGNGEFFDLLPLIDYCQEIGMDIIQLLPINDTGDDPSPYNALSSRALHPIYLSLHALPYLSATSTLLKELQPLKDLPLKRIDYPTLLATKMKWLKKYIAAHGDEIKKEETYNAFYHRYQWLQEYALFKALQERYDHKHWKHWPDQKHASAKEMEHYCLEQYLCFQQLKEVKAYANQRNVFLKGDIPILVSPDSADVWAHREYFDMSLAAGSPPNFFNAEGQYWGFPLYNWKAMHENNYEWWKTRLLVARELYDLYRIDHVMGLFRMWAIPPGHPPSNGRYVPDDLALMEAQGKEFLETFVHTTDMLPIGEDLGNTPPFARKCLDNMGVCGTRVLRWERNWEGDQSWIPISKYSPSTLSTVSTHDLNTVTLWWQYKKKEAMAFAHEKNWEYHKAIASEQLYTILHDSHHSASLFHINLLQEYLALTPELTWENPEDERINYPGTVQPLNWTYCYKEPLEVLLTHEKLREYFIKLI